MFKIWFSLALTIIGCAIGGFSVGDKVYDLKAHEFIFSIALTYAFSYGIVYFLGFEKEFKKIKQLRRKVNEKKSLSQLILERKEALNKYLEASSSDKGDAFNHFWAADQKVRKLQETIERKDYPRLWDKVKTLI